MKKALALILTLIMVLGLMPAAMAEEAPVEGKVTITKSLVSDKPDESGNYTIKLTVQGNPVTQSAQPNADVVLVVDNSGSMASSVGDPCKTPKDEFIYVMFGIIPVFKCPTCGAVYPLIDLFVPDVCTGQIGETVRINAARDVGKTFAENILKGTGNKMAVIGFAGSSGGADESDAIKVSTGLTADRNVIESGIDKMSAEGGTNYTAALQKAYDILDARSDDDKASRPGYVIFISDGAPGAQGESQGKPDWDGSNQVAALKNAGITIYTIGIALDENSEAYSYLQNMASEDQDDHFKNVSGTDYQKQLNSILNDWADDINTVPAGTNAVMTDVINTDKFDYVEGSASTELTVSEIENKTTLTWDIGDIPETTQSVTFKVRPKDGWTGTENTNVSCTLTYTKPDNTEGSATATSPTVTIAATTGKIVVRKNVVMPDGDNTIVRDKEYSFTIRQEDGTYSETKEVTIGDNKTGSVTFENVPFGNYTVTESDAGMQGYAVTTTSDPANGTVTVSDTADGNITFTNTYTPETIITYPVQIKKEASGLLEGTTYPNVTVDIKQGEKVIKTITGLVPNGRAEIVQLPAGEYTVEERSETAGVDGYNLDVTNAELTVTAPVEAERSTALDAVETVATATITNTYTKMQADTGSLTVKKTVSGGGASYNKEFTFTVTLTEYNDHQNGEVTYGGVTFTNGVATFTLKHNQEKSITGIPAGYTYTVTENADGYTQSITSGSATGTIEKGETATVTFNNYKSGGDHYYPTPDPVPPIVIPPNTGDMTIWQSILHFLGIR